MREFKNMTIKELAAYYKENISHDIFPKFEDWISNLISCNLINNEIVVARKTLKS